MAEVLYPSSVPENDLSSFPVTTSPWTESSTFTSSGQNFPDPYMLSDSGASSRHGQHHYYSEPAPIEDDSRRRNPSFSAPPDAYLGNQMTVPSQSSSSLPYDNVSQPSYSQALYPQAMEPPLGPSPPTRSQYTPIAPDPIGIQRMQSSRDYQDPSRGRRRRSTAPVEQQAPPALRDDERFLLSLKDDQNLPWKEIANRFQTDLGQTHQVAALQMRYQRLKQRLRVWTESDVSALRQAHEYWETRKWDIISEKMLEFGATEKFTQRACSRKWQEINPTSEGFLGQFGYGTSRSVSPAPPPAAYPPSSYPPSTYWSQFFYSPPTTMDEFTSSSRRKRARTLDDDSVDSLEPVKKQRLSSTPSRY